MAGPNVTRIADGLRAAGLPEYAAQVIHAAEQDLHDERHCGEFHLDCFACHAELEEHTPELATDAPGAWSV
jgi:hypothetical protein